MSGTRALRVWLNGRILPVRKAKIPVFDRGFLFGDGVYETVRVYSGVPFRLEEHLDRMAQSAGRLGFRLPWGKSILTRALMATLQANRLKEARARYVVSRGEGVPDLQARGKLKPNVLIYATPYSPPSVKERTQGVPVVISKVVRNDRRGLDPAIKSLNLLNNLLAKQDAWSKGAKDAIMLNARGQVTEATNANVFFIRRGIVCTPGLKSGILAGITRGIILELARRMGFPAREGLFGAGSLLRSDEVFLTASTIEILPVSRLDGRRFLASRPYTRALQEAYRITVDDETKPKSASRS